VTLIYGNSIDGPGTHALIVGAGAFSGTGDSPDPAVETARRIANWLETAFVNEKTPLATVELLASASQSVNYRVSPGFPMAVEQPSFAVLGHAVKGWRARADRHPDNVALFYFAGSGGPEEKRADEHVLVVPRDTGQLKAIRLVSFAGILALMSDCRARQVYFVDTKSVGYAGLRGELLWPSVPENRRSRSAVFHSFSETDEDYGFPYSRFAADVMAALDSPREAAAAVTVEDLARDLRVRSAGRKLHRLVTAVNMDVELHFPSHSPAPRLKPTSPFVEQPAASAQAKPARKRKRPAREPNSTAPDELPLAVQGGETSGSLGPDAAAKSAQLEPPGTETKAPPQPMTKGDMIAVLREKEVWLPGKRVKLNFGPDGLIVLDGVENRITEENGPADILFKLDWGDWVAATEGTLDGMTAFIEKKLRTKGFTDDAMTFRRAVSSHRTSAPEPGPSGRPHRPKAEHSGGSADPAPAKKRVRAKRPSEAAAGPPQPTPPSVESATEFVPDDAETERDELGRSVLAIGLARRLHRIWRSANESGAPPAGDDERAAFVVHLDAPWGGGKTSFANYLGRVLDPAPGGRAPAAFLRERYGEADLGGIFLDDPPADPAAAERLAALPAVARRPWIVVPFNAWQVEHCAPPWWVFYQTIRKGCFDSVLKEGDLPWSPRTGRPRLPLPQRLDTWAKLWLREYWWRLANPKVRSLFVTAAVSLLLLLLLQRFGIWGMLGGKDPKTGFILTSGLGLVLGGLTGVTFLWGLAALFTESIVPGTDTLAERLSLGSGDPFARFRRHFARTIARVRRPVMVVVDDLDRCRPDFVVGLVRGIQTLLRSPRVVFVILGDRDWIERAFEAHHKAMEKVDVGPEQTFGARFVEKAIQMSFILPAMGDEGRLAYVRRVLLGAGPQTSREATAAMTPPTAQAVREIVNREAAEPDSDPFDTQRILDRALEAAGYRADTASADDVALHHEVEQLVGETLAINATSSERVEQAVAHQLEALAAHFPANPRQIKRIVNAITVYYAVALQRPGLNPDEAFRTQLALWIIIMTEWPETWRLLASFPALVPILQSADPTKAVKAKGLDLPGSPEATAALVRRIAADAELMALIKGVGAPPLDPARIPLLAQLTPLHSRKRRLSEEKAPEPDRENEAELRTSKPARNLGPGPKKS